MGTLSGEGTLEFFSLPNWVNSFRKEFTPCRSKFFPQRADPVLGGLCCSGKQKLSPFVKMVEKFVNPCPSASLCGIKGAAF